MKIRRWETPDPSGTNEYLDYGLLQTDTSQRDTLGHLKLVQHSHLRNVGKVLYTKRVNGFGGVLRGADKTLAFYDPQRYEKEMSILYNAAYAKFRGKLYDGSAAIGVTAASYRQSADMIRNRYTQMSQPIDHMLAQWASGPKHAKRLAGTHLEIIFGWQPLVEDIQKAAKSVIQKADQYTFVKGRAQTPYRDVRVKPLTSSLSANWEYELRLSTCVSATVTIKNRNLWLLERAGALNVGSVAWDLVPWSFVVNMFVNTGQIVNSITDFVGLEFSDSGVTRSVKGLYWSQYGWYDSYGERQVYNSYKERTLGYPPRPSLEFRLPGVNWGTVAMAASLFTQKFSRLSGYLTRFTK